MNIYRSLGDLLRNRWPMYALALYGKALKSADDDEKTDLLLDIAVIYDELGDAASAEKTYLGVISSNPAEARAYYGIAVLNGIRKNYRKAIEYYNRAISAKPDYSRAYYFLGLIYDDLGQKEKAIENLKRVIELDPSDFWAHNNLGVIYEELDRNDLALGMFKQALKILPKQYKALFNTGVVLGKMGYPEKAAEYYAESIRTKTDYPYSYLNLALLYKEQRDYRRAIEIISKGLQYSKSSAFLYYHRACCYVYLDRPGEAMDDLDRAVSLERGLADEMQSDEELAPLRGLEKFKLLADGGSGDI